MLEKEAEYNYVKEFKDFCVGLYSDFIPHYNFIEENDYESYREKISELTSRLQLEIESNLVYLSDSNSKCVHYLEKVLSKVLPVRDKIDWFQAETEQQEVLTKTNDGFKGEYGFQNKLWWHHITLTDGLIDFLRERINFYSAKKRKTKGRTAITDEKIIWKSSSGDLRRLYLAITSDVDATGWNGTYRFIGETTFAEFERHFIRGTGKPNSKLDWRRELYMLSFFFDQLYAYNCIDELYSTNNSILLSIHFSVKGKPIKSLQIHSSRNTLKKRTIKIPEAKRNALLFLSNLAKAYKIKPKAEDGEDIRLSEKDAWNRF